VLRLALLSPVVGLLTVGGVALAEDAGIVDPWSGSLSGWFADPDPDALWVTPRPVATGAARVKTNAGPVVLPLAAAPGGDHIVVEPWNPAPIEVTPYPWATAGREGRSSLSSLSTPALASVHPRVGWAYQVNEIVDPWGRGAGAVWRDPLIVDPWAP